MIGGICVCQKAGITEKDPIMKKQKARDGQNYLKII